jgi:glycopeptide antibiotics resistance protein
MIIELLQSKLFIYRSTDFLDFLANTLGALSMTVVLYLKKEVIVKKL